MSELNANDWAAQLDEELGLTSGSVPVAEPVTEPVTTEVLDWAAQLDKKLESTSGSVSESNVPSVPVEVDDTRLVPVAYDPEDLSVDSPPVGSFDKEYSWWDRTQKAWDNWSESLEPVVDDDGVPLSNSDMKDLGNTIAEALIETDDRGTSKLSPIRRPTPDEYLISSLLSSDEDGSRNTKILLNLAGALEVGGAVFMDVVEDTLERGMDNKITGGMLDYVAKLATEIRDLGPYKRNEPMQVDPKKFVDALGTATLNTLEFSETLPALGILSTVLTTKALRPSSIAKKTVKANNRRLHNLKVAYRNNYSGARFATTQEKFNAKEAAAAIAADFPEIKDELILAYEASVGGRKISKQVGDHLEIDYKLATAEGKNVIRKDIKIVTGKDGPEAEVDTFATLLGSEDSILKPILDPAIMNSLVAVVVDYKKKMKIKGLPNAFESKNSKRISKLKAKKKNSNLSQQETEELKALIKNNKGPMKTLLDLTVMKDLDATADLIDILNKYDLSLEQFILSSVGSFSEAGTILQIAKQLGRVRPSKDIESEKIKRLLAAEAGIANASQRLEDVRRGMLVSKFATAGRNFESTIVRMPLESLMNVIDEVTYSFNEPAAIGSGFLGLGEGAKGGYVGAIKALSRKETWKDSFKAHKYVFSRPDVADGFMKLMLEQPEFVKYYSNMYDNINEIQKATGRGAGGGVDKFLIQAEDVTTFANTFNRWQESVSRNAFALSDLERLVKRHWKIDLIDTLNDGKLKDLMNDASTVKPKDARSFSSMMAESVDRALSATYANQPDGKMAKATVQFLTRQKLGGVIPLTVFVEFPKFMFSSLEYIGQSSFGAAMPMLKKAVGLRKDGFTVKEQRAIQRNLVGAAAIGAAYMYRKSENAPQDSRIVTVGGKDIDVSTQFPLAQIFYIADAIDNLAKGTFDLWFDPKRASETFLGTAFRTGTGNIFIEEVTSILDGLDVSGGIKSAEITGQALGNYIWGYFNFFTQIPDLQRTMPKDTPNIISQLTGQYPRPTEYRQDPSKSEMPKTASDAFFREVMRGGEIGGLTVSAQTEASFPPKQTVFPSLATRPDAKWKTFLGLSVKDEANVEEKFVQSLGIPLWKVGSNSDVKSIQGFENKQLSLFIPMVVDTLKAREATFKNEYWRQSDASSRKKVSLENFVKRRQKAMFEKLVSEKKKLLKATSSGVAERYSIIMVEYNKIPKDYRREAIIRYQLKNGGSPPDLTKRDIITKLIVEANILKKLDSKLARDAVN